MDPTKSFDHLDPKLKETYARVMGTQTNGDGTPAQDASADPSSIANPGADLGIAQQPMDPTSLSASPFDATAATIPTQEGPNPGTGPTISTMPTEPTLSNAPWDPASTTTPDQSSPPNSSFFTNPSPTTTDPLLSSPSNGMDAPGELPPEQPVAPYASPEQLAQPLPSPAAVNQTAARTVSPLLKVLYIVGAVVFFAIYTVFWIKIFNLPFLF